MRSGSAQRPPGGRNNGNRPFPQQQRTPQRGQTFDSNGPNIKIRGGAHQIFERYIALAREAAIGNDHVTVENFYQHAEHYFRVANAARDSNQQGASPTTPANAAIRDDEQPTNAPDPDRSQPGSGDVQSDFT